MNPKIQPQAIEKLQGKHPKDLVSLKIRITSSLDPEEISLLTKWGGTLLFDSGIMAIVTIPTNHVNDLAEWEKVLDII